MQQNGPNLSNSPVKNIVPKNGLTAMIAVINHDSNVAKNLKTNISGLNAKGHLSNNDNTSFSIKKCNEIKATLLYSFTNCNIQVQQSSPQFDKLHISVGNEMSVEVNRRAFLSNRENFYYYYYYAEAILNN